MMLAPTSQVQVRQPRDFAADKGADLDDFFKCYAIKLSRGNQDRVGYYWAIFEPLLEWLPTRGACDIGSLMKVRHSDITEYLTNLRVHGEENEDHSHYVDSLQERLQMEAHATYCENPIRHTAMYKYIYIYIYVSI